MFLWVDTQRKDRLRRTDTEKQTERQRVRHTDRRTDRQTHDRQTSVPIATLTVITRFSDVLRLQAYRDYLPNLFVVNQIQCKALKRVDQAPDAYFPLFLSGRFFSSRIQLLAHRVYTVSEIFWILQEFGLHRLEADLKSLPHTAPF